MEVESGSKYRTCREESERIPGVRWYRAALPERSRKTVEWLVKAEKPAIVKVKAISEKAGIHSREVKIGMTP